jgi:hypothetical protein
VVWVGFVDSGLLCVYTSIIIYIVINWELCPALENGGIGLIKMLVEILELKGKNINQYILYTVTIPFV